MYRGPFGKGLRGSLLNVLFMMMQGPPSGILGLKTGSDLETGQGIKNFHWEQLLSTLWLSIPEFLCFINWACLCQLLAYLAPGDLGSIRCLHSSLQVRTLWLLHQPRHSLWKLDIPCCYRWSATTWLLLLLCLIIPITDNSNGIVMEYWWRKPFL